MLPDVDIPTMSYSLYHSCLDTQPTPSLISFSSSSRTAMVTGGNERKTKPCFGCASICNPTQADKWFTCHHQHSIEMVICSIAAATAIQFMRMDTCIHSEPAHPQSRQPVVSTPFPSLLFLTTNHEQRQVCVCIVLHCFPTSSSGTTYRLLLHFTHLPSVSCC